MWLFHSYSILVSQDNERSRNWVKTMQTNVTLLELQRSTVQVATVCYRYFIHFFLNKRHLAEWEKIFVYSTNAHINS